MYNEIIHKELFYQWLQEAMSQPLLKMAGVSQ